MATPMDIARPAGLRWDQAPQIGIPAESGYTTLQPVGVDRVRNDQNQGAFRINVYDPSFVDLDSMELLFEVGIQSRVPQQVTLGKGIASIFRKITLRDPTDNILDEVQEYNHLDAMVSSLNLPGNVRSMQSLQDGSRVQDPLEHILKQNPTLLAGPAAFGPLAPPTTQPAAVGIYNQTRWAYLAPNLKRLSIRPKPHVLVNSIATIGNGANAVITLTTDATALIQSGSTRPIQLGDRIVVTGASGASKNTIYTVTGVALVTGQLAFTTSTSSGNDAFVAADGSYADFFFAASAGEGTVDILYNPILKEVTQRYALSALSTVSDNVDVVFEVTDFVYSGGEKKEQYGPQLVAGLPGTELILYPMAMNLNHLSLMRSGKTFPLSILTGSGLKLDFELARSQQCVLGSFVDDTTVIFLQNIRLRLRRQTFQDSFNVATNAMLLERGNISMPSTKWICSHGQLGVGQNRVIVSQTASSIKFVMFAIVPNYMGQNGSTLGANDPFLRSVANIQQFQIYLGGKEIPSQAIMVADSQASRFEEVSGLAAQSYRFWNGKQAIYEYFTAVQKTADKDFDCLLQPETWGVNHYDAQGVRVPSLPAGSMIFAVSLEPYKTHGLRSVGMNTSQNGVPLELRFFSPRVIPSFHYISAMLVDSMNIVTAAGGMQTVF